MNKIHIVAGALAIFFLAVAIAKSVSQHARKNKAKRESVERSKSENISLHNPYPGDAPADEATAAPAENAPAAPAAPPAPPPAAPAQPEQPPPQESAYKWN